ncbi:MAG: AmmeMemoRadiSam system radical SAM enzyme [Bacteroidales bacterium]
MLAKYYTPKDDGTVICDLCPHTCHLKQGKSGICGVRKNNNGTLELLNVGTIASSGLDPIEKKPLYHYHPGKKIYSIGSYGCNLKCVFCQNNEISQHNPERNYDWKQTQPIDLVLKAKLLPENIGIAYTYNEPTVFFEFMVQTAELAKQEYLKNVMVSNGFINLKPLDELIQFIDAFNIDLKSFSDNFYRELTGGRLNPVLNTLSRIKDSGKHLEIAFLVIPTKNDDPKDAQAMFDWIAENLGNDTVLHINKYYPAYKMQIPATSTEKLSELYEIAKDKLQHVYIGNLHSAEIGCHTQCPSCMATVIKRSGYHTSITALDSRGFCKICGYGPIAVMD